MSNTLRMATNMQYDISLQEGPSLSQERTCLNEPWHSRHPQLSHLGNQYPFDLLSLHSLLLGGYISVTPQLAYLVVVTCTDLVGNFNLPLRFGPAGTRRGPYPRLFAGDQSDFHFKIESKSCDEV